MKILFLFFYAVILFIPLFIYDFLPNESLLSTLYNVIGIVFAIGMGLIVTFSTQGIENKNYIVEIRQCINTIRNKFIILFSICTLLFVFKGIHPSFISKYPKITPIYVISFFLVAIIYFILNFIRLQKLKDDILDRLLKEKKGQVA